jgi:putative transcriptional regulator
MNVQTLQGHLLVASPKLVDPNFVETVVLMVQHNDEGALGVILNRSTNTSINDLWDQVSQKPCLRNDALHHGGPCEGPLMVVHRHEETSQIEVLGGVHFSTETHNVEWLVENDDGPIKFFVGCAGWAPGQLESELKTGSWLAAPATCDHVFRSGDDLWRQVTRQITSSMAFPPLAPEAARQNPSLN